MSSLKFNFRQFFDINYYKALFWDVSHREENTKSKFDKYVSLGRDCFPRTFLTMHGIKPWKKDGEKSMPLDLMYYKDLNKIINFILYDFEGFLLNIYFDEKDKIFRSKDKILNFNHDKDIDGDIEKLKLRYENRIKNLSEIFNSDLNILFVIHARPNFNINLLYRILKYKKKRNFKLMVINTHSKPMSKRIRKEIIVINKPFPENNYVWHEQMHSKTGVQWENELEKIVREYL